MNNIDNLNERIRKKFTICRMANALSKGAMIQEVRIGNVRLVRTKLKNNRIAFTKKEENYSKISTFDNQSKLINKWQYGFRSKKPFSSSSINIINRTRDYDTKKTMSNYDLVKKLYLDTPRIYWIVFAAGILNLFYYLISLKEIDTSSAKIGVIQGLAIAIIALIGIIELRYLRRSAR